MFSFGCIIVELVTGQKLFESDVAILRFADKHTKETNELPCNWPNAKFGDLLYRLRRLTARLITPDPLSRPGSVETERRLRDVRKGVDWMVACDNCGGPKVEWEACEMCPIYAVAERGPRGILEEINSMFRQDFGSDRT